MMQQLLKQEVLSNEEACEGDSAKPPSLGHTDTETLSNDTVLAVGLMERHHAQSQSQAIPPSPSPSPSTTPSAKPSTTSPAHTLPQFPPIPPAQAMPEAMANLQPEAMLVPPQSHTTSTPIPNTVAERQEITQHYIMTPSQAMPQAQEMQPVPGSSPSRDIPLSHTVSASEPIPPPAALPQSQLMPTPTPTPPSQAASHPHIMSSPVALPQPQQMRPPNPSPPHQAVPNSQVIPTSHSSVPKEGTVVRRIVRKVADVTGLASIISRYNEVQAAYLHTNGFGRIQLEKFQPITEKLPDGRKKRADPVFLDAIGVFDPMAINGNFISPETAVLLGYDLVPNEEGAFKTDVSGGEGVSDHHIYVRVLINRTTTYLRAPAMIPELKLYVLYSTMWTKYGVHIAIGTPTYHKIKLRYKNRRELFAFGLPDQSNMPDTNPRFIAMFGGIRKSISQTEMDAGIDQYRVQAMMRNAEEKRQHQAAKEKEAQKKKEEEAQKKTEVGA